MLTYIIQFIEDHHNLCLNKLLNLDQILINA
jgi:hypothetical protein